MEVFAGYYYSPGYLKNILIDFSEDKFYYLNRGDSYQELKNEFLKEFKYNSEEINYTHTIDNVDKLKFMMTEFVINSFITYKQFCELIYSRNYGFLSIKCEPNFLDSLLDNLSQCFYNGMINYRMIYLHISPYSFIEKINHFKKFNQIKFVYEHCMLPPLGKNYFVIDIDWVILSLTCNPINTNRVKIITDLDRDNVIIDSSKAFLPSKFEVDICKDCEHKLICHDNRFPLCRNDNNWYHEIECNYNPYIAKWKGEDGYHNLEECGVVSNENGFSIDHDQIARINKELWGEV